MSITHEFARQFAEDWISAWNSHDMDRILVLYADDFTIRSPTALAVVPESSGFIAGKESIKRYWLKAMEQLPDLTFRLLDVFVGIEGISLHFLNTTAHKRVIEVMLFNEHKKVTQVLVYHSDASAQETV